MNEAEVTNMADPGALTMSSTTAAERSADIERKIEKLKIEMDKTDAILEKKMIETQEKLDGALGKVDELHDDLMRGRLKNDIHEFFDYLVDKQRQKEQECEEQDACKEYYCEHRIKAEQAHKSLFCKMIDNRVIVAICYFERKQGTRGGSDSKDCVLEIAVTKDTYAEALLEVFQHLVASNQEAYRMFREDVDELIRLAQWRHPALLRGMSATFLRSTRPE